MDRMVNMMTVTTVAPNGRAMLLRENGAGDEDRTRNFQLGNQNHRSPPREAILDEADREARAWRQLH
jgi:hypothetical protein